MSENKLGHNEFGTGVGTLMWITLSPWIWAVHFTVCYALTAILCVKTIAGGDTSTLRLALGAVTVVALGGIVTAGISGWRRWTEGGYGEDGATPGIDDIESRNRFLGHVSVLLSVVSGVGVIFVILPVLLIGSCR